MSIQSERSGTGVVGEQHDPFTARWTWKGGMAAGFVATLVMGVTIGVMQLETLRLAIAGLYGSPGSLAVGWVAHLIHGTVFGAIFAGILTDPGLYGLTRWRWKTLVAGVVFGLVLAIVGAGIIMPIWLGFVGFPTPPSIPNVTLPILGWHLVYGTVLGLVYPFVDDW